ncbi:MAG: hypothetical protein MRY83_13265 [Flavobacteriales bacterium]|nr:hypothetical protein [Flavobacteriales bacterium]
MKGIDNIDDLFKKKFENDQVSMNPGSFEDFSAFVEGNEKKKRRPFLWLLLFIPIGVLLFLFNQTPQEIEKSFQDKTPSKISELETSITEKKPESDTKENLDFPAKEKSVKLDLNTQIHVDDRIIKKPHLKQATPTPINESLETSDAKDDMIQSNELNTDNNKEIVIDKENLPALNDTIFYENLEYIPVNIRTEQGNNVPEFYEGQSRKSKYYTLEMTFGAAVAPAFDKSEGRKYRDVNVSPIIGITYAQRLDQAFSLDLGLVYNFRGGIQQNYKESSHDFVAQKLHIFNVPMYFNYRSDRHNYLLGAQLSFIPAMSTKNIQNEQFDWWTKNYGYTKFDGALSVGYEYVINENLNIGTRLNLGLFDFTDEAILSGSHRHRDLQIRLQIDHKLK